jgi:hypothetical protein
MEVFTVIFLAIFALAALAFVIFLVIFFFSLIASILKTPAQVTSNNTFDNDEPDGSNYYEVNGQVRLE